MKKTRTKTETRILLVDISLHSINYQAVHGLDTTPRSSPPQNKTSGTMFSPKNCLNTIKINQLHKIICHFACDYFCAALVQIYNIKNPMIQSERKKGKKKTKTKKQHLKQQNNFDLVWRQSLSFATGLNVNSLSCHVSSFQHRLVSPFGIIYCPTSEELTSFCGNSWSSVWEALSTFFFFFLFTGELILW